MFPKKKSGNAKDFFNSLPPKQRAMALFGIAVAFYLFYSLMPSFSHHGAGTGEVTSSGEETLSTSIPETAETGNKMTYTMWDRGGREVCFFDTSKSLTNCMSEHDFFALKRSASGEAVKDDSLLSHARDPHPDAFSSILNTLTKPGKE